MQIWYIRFVEQRITLWLFLVVATCLLAGCATMENSWIKAQRYNSSRGYELFIKSYPDSPHVSEARSRIENLTYERAAKRDQISGYEKFIEKYPTGELNERVRNRIAILRKEEEDRAYVKAKEKDSIENYESFLDKYPASEYVRDIKIALVRVKRQKEDELYEAASSEGSYIKFSQYESQYPNGRYITEVHKSLKHFHWKPLGSDRLLTWKKLGTGTPLNSDKLTEELRSILPRTSIYGHYLVGGAVTMVRDMIFVMNGASAFGKMTVKPTQFSIVTAKNTLLKMETNFKDDRILMMGGKIVVAVGSRIILDYTKSTEGGSGLSAIGKSDIMIQTTEISGGSNVADLGGINLFGTICRSGSVAVTIEGLLLAKGTEVLEMR